MAQQLIIGDPAKVRIGPKIYVQAKDEYGDDIEGEFEILRAVLVFDERLDDWYQIGQAVDKG